MYTWKVSRLHKAHQEASLVCDRISAEVSAIFKPKLDPGLGLGLGFIAACAYGSFSNGTLSLGLQWQASLKLEEAAKELNLLLQDCEERRAPMSAGLERRMEMVSISQKGDSEALGDIDNDEPIDEEEYQTSLA